MAGLELGELLAEFADAGAGGGVSMVPFSNAVWYFAIAPSVLVTWLAMAVSSASRSLLPPS